MPKSADDWDPVDDRQQQRTHAYRIALLLRQKLVPEVVPSIIKEAELLETFIYTRQFSDSIHVHARRSPQHILVTPPITSHLRRIHPVVSVTFKVLSHDQGWVSGRHSGSTNWTWFSARIIRPSTEHDSSADEPLVHLNGSDRELFKNKLSEKNFAWHIAEWRADSVHESEAAWVRSLTVGDRIAIAAWAGFESFANHIQHAEVVVKTLACTH